jgi:hypothetical protein
MAEIYRYKGRLYVIRKNPQNTYLQKDEIVLRIGKNGMESPTPWSGDVIRTLGNAVTGWKGENDGGLPLPSRFNDRKLTSVG